VYRIPKHKRRKQKLLRKQENSHEFTDFSEVTLFTELTDIPDLQFETTVTAKTEKTSSLKNPTISEQASKLASSGSYLANTYNALNFKEQKGFWISYLEYYRMLKNKSKPSLLPI
jgi:hypothetical protein